MADCCNTNRFERGRLADNHRINHTGKNVSRTTLLRLDAAVIGSLLAVFAKNWKDVATILFLAVLVYGAGREYAVAASETARFYATVFVSFLCGYAVISYVGSRIDRLSEASPFSEESLDRVHAQIYLGAWSIASLVVALTFAALVYPAGMFYAVATWFGASLLSFLVSAYRKVAVSLGVSSDALGGVNIRRLAGIAAAVIAISAIGLKALSVTTSGSVNAVLIAGHGAALMLFSPVNAAEIQFLRIMGIGFVQRCIGALLPILALTSINCALVYTLLDDLSLLASAAIVAFAVATYRILQIGLFRMMSVRAAEVALGLYILCLLLLGLTFPPLAAVFYGSVLIFVWFRARRATWLME
jgi:hypothetical protein